MVMVEENIYLRYHEIKFQQFIIKLYTSHPAAQAQIFLQTSLDLMQDLSPSLVLNAVRRVLSLDSTLKIFRPEMIICIGEVEGISKLQIRKQISCSPNTVLQAYKDLASGDLHVQPRFDIMTSRAIQLYMDNIKQLFNA